MSNGGTYCNFIFLPTGISARDVCTIGDGVFSVKKQLCKTGINIVLGLLPADSLKVVNPGIDNIAQRIASCLKDGICDLGLLIKEFGDSVRIIKTNSGYVELPGVSSESSSKINVLLLRGKSRGGFLAAAVANKMECVLSGKVKLYIDSPVPEVFGAKSIDLSAIKNTNVIIKYEFFSKNSGFRDKCRFERNWLTWVFFKQQKLNGVCNSSISLFERDRHLGNSSRLIREEHDGGELNKDFSLDKIDFVKDRDRNRRALFPRGLLFLLATPFLPAGYLLFKLWIGWEFIISRCSNGKQSEFDKSREEIFSRTKQIAEAAIKKQIDGALGKGFGESSEYNKILNYLKTFPKESIKGLDALKQYMHFLDDFLPEIKKSYFDSEGNFKSEAEKVWLYSRATKHMCKRFKHSEGLVFNFLRGLVQVLVLPIRLAQVIYKASMNTKCAKRKFFESVPFWGKHKTRRGMKMSTDLKEKMGLSNKNFTRRPGAKAQIEELINNPDKIEDYDHQRASDLFKRLNIPSNLTAYFSSMDEQYKKEYYIFDMIDKLIPETRPGDAQVNRRGEPRGALALLGMLAREDSSVEESQRTMYV